MKLRIKTRLVAILLIMFTISATVFTGEEALSKLHFPKLKNYKVELKCLTSDLKFSPGKEAKVTFGLQNIGATPIMCHEWKMEESQNLSIFYTEWKGEKNLKDAIWKNEIPKITENSRLMPLELAPKNVVLIDKKLNFIEQIPQNIKTPLTFYIYAELNLKSMNARSPMIKVIVSP